MHSYVVFAVSSSSASSSSSSSASSSSCSSLLSTPSSPSQPRTASSCSSRRSGMGTHQQGSMNEVHSARARKPATALQVWECIRYVKHNIIHTDDDHLSSAAFGWLVCGSYLTLLAVFLTWELYLSPEANRTA